MLVSAQNNFERLLKITGILHGKELLARGQGERETNFLLYIICTFLNFVPSICSYLLQKSIIEKSKGSQVLTRFEQVTD